MKKEKLLSRLLDLVDVVDRDDRQDLDDGEIEDLVMEARLYNKQE